jgi:hypothetical protein
MVSAASLNETTGQNKYVVLTMDPGFSPQKRDNELSLSLNPNWQNLKELAEFVLQFSFFCGLRRYQRTNSLSRHLNPQSFLNPSN